MPVTIPVRYGDEGIVSDREFCQKVRAFSPSTLLPIIAVMSGRHRDTWKDDLAKSPYRPWALAEIARVSLAYGSEYRPPADLLSLNECINKHSALGDRNLARSGPDSAARFFLRVSGEQFPAQQPVFNELTRTIALFEQTTAAKPLEVLGRPDWAVELLGAPLREYLATGLLLFIASLPNDGTFSPDWLDQPNLEPIVSEVPAETIREQLGRHFVTDVAGFRALQAAAPVIEDLDARRFGFNPLMSKPLISGMDPEGRLLVPAPHLLITKVSPLGIYHLGVAKWGTAFTQDLGTLFEAYVGRQLEQMAGLEALHPAVVYDKNGSKETVDWIAVFPELVLLVEVKSTRPTEPVRAGTADAVAKVSGALKRSVEQINTTAALIRDQHPKLPDIPRDRLVAGLTVTMEPFHVINGGLFEDWLPKRDVQGSICGAFELEMLVMTETPAAALVSAWNDPERRGWPIKSVLAEQQVKKQNALLLRAFDTIPWFSTFVPDES